jgi:hypothetical protein
MQVYNHASKVTYHILSIIAHQLKIRVILFVIREVENPLTKDLVTR